MRGSEAVRVPVAPDPLIDGSPDYADCFEMGIDPADPRTAEGFARNALDEAPALIYWTILVAHRHLLRLRLAPRRSPVHVIGWTIAVREQDVAKLEADGPLVRAVIVGRRSGSSVRVTTALYFKRKLIARVLMATVAPVHRAVVAYLLQQAASRPASAGNFSPDKNA